MKLGSKGEALIKSFEQFRASSYLDERGIPTIGWGHTGWYSAGVPVSLGQTCASEQGEDWFLRDIAEAVNGVNRCVDVALNQNQFDALTSFAYNVGVGALAHSTLLHYVNMQMLTVAADQFLRWEYAGGRISEGLERRRRAERELFLAPLEAP